MVHVATKIRLSVDVGNLTIEIKAYITKFPDLPLICLVVAPYANHTIP